MAPLKLAYASCKYDRIEALRSGEVQVEGIDLNVIVSSTNRAASTCGQGASAIRVLWPSAAQHSSAKCGIIGANN